MKLVAYMLFQTQNLYLVNFKNYEIYLLYGEVNLVVVLAIQYCYYTQSQNVANTLATDFLHYTVTHNFAIVLAM